MVHYWQDMDVNPYSIWRGYSKLGTMVNAEGAPVEDELGRTCFDREAGEWERVWLIFKRHLAMQRVQRVNTKDLTVPLEWKRASPGTVEAEMALKRMEERELREREAFTISLKQGHCTFLGRRGMKGRS